MKPPVFIKFYSCETNDRDAGNKREVSAIIGCEARMSRGARATARVRPYKNGPCRGAPLRSPWLLPEIRLNILARYCYNERQSNGSVLLPGSITRGMELSCSRIIQLRSLNRLSREIVP